MLTNLRLELRKALRKSRMYIGPAAMSLLILAVAVGLKHSNPFEFLRRRMEQDFIVTGSFINAAFLCRHLLEGITYTFLPLFACMVCGDLIASEAADGTIRTLLCRPITRAQVVISKYMVACMYVLALSIGTGVLAYVMGTAFLGRGSLVLFSGGIWVLPETTAIVRLAAAYALVAAGMLAVGSISFAVSTFLSNSNGAIGAAMGILYGSAVIQEIEYFKVLKPYLLTTHLDKWHRLFTGAFDAHAFLKAILVMLIYSAVSFAIGLIIFRRRDVLS